MVQFTTLLGRLILQSLDYLRWRSGTDLLFDPVRVEHLSLVFFVLPFLLVLVEQMLFHLQSLGLASDFEMPLITRKEQLPLFLLCLFPHLLFQVIRVRVRVGRGFWIVEPWRLHFLQLLLVARLGKEKRCEHGAALLFLLLVVASFCSLQVLANQREVLGSQDLE